MCNRRLLTIQTDNRGRLLLPKDLREQIGLEAKAIINVEVFEDGSVVLRDPRADRARRLAAAQGSHAGQGRPTDEFIAERRAEAAREDDR